ncbi:arylsulfatase [Pedobacter yulinensis]|uniref:Arylsulfatase n=1 Tax=Pedobacter yulinensis TaxID=2126353 RepID=A0A2T3HPC9_9SPHI|nr:arylsulfatase [Pedobacter yulinensis]PST84286.1 arylsulfatase [Pedobacter yulinensis]
MKRIKLLCLILALPVFLAAQQKKPNIIIILADDLGWGDVGFHGSGIRTPNLDQLAREGVELTRYYTAPICSPTRVGLLTGRYPNRSGIRETTIPPWSDFGLDTTEELLPQMLARSGYIHRAIIGKWHLGHASLSYHPMQRGFTHFYGHLNGAIDYFSQMREGERDWHNDLKPSADTGYATELITREAVKCIGAYAGDAPFFMYVAYNAPHGPFQAPEAWLKQYGYDPAKPKYGKKKPADPGEETGDGLGHGNTIRQTYAAMVSCMDDGIGQIMKALKDKGIDEHTIVLFHSDNGAAGSGNSGSHGSLRGYKFDEWEGGVRAPALVRWKGGGLKGGTRIDQVMGYVDIFPTLKAIAGQQEAAKKTLDGLNLWPVLNGSAGKLDREFYLGHGALLSGDWKLILDQGRPNMKLNGDVLFRIPPDDAETENVRAAHPDVYKRLKAAVAPYEAIRSKKEILSKGPKNGFVAPKDWQITKK